MRHAALLAACLSLGCGLWPFGGDGPGPTPDPAHGLELVEDPALVAFHARASAFYGRLARRRFDSIQTYQDEALRDYFRTEAAFADYYADLTSALVEAHFEKNRPVALEVASADSVFTAAYQPGQRIELPVAHHDGCYVCAPDDLKRLEDEDRIVLRYLDNPNGSVADVAGLLGPGRNVLGIMPHPERAADPRTGGTDGQPLLRGLIEALS